MSQQQYKAGQTGQPFAVGIGQVITLTPSPITPSSGYIEYSLSSPASVLNNTAVWSTWPKGTVSVLTADMAVCPQFLRVTCLTGFITVDIGDPAENSFFKTSPWQSDIGTPPFDVNGNYIGLPNAGTLPGMASPALLWSQRPSASLYPGAAFRFTDVGGHGGDGGGNYFFSNGTRYKPVNGSITLDTIDTFNTGVTGVAEQQLNPNHIIIPAGVIQGFDRIRFWLGFSKSGTTDTATLNIRLGSAGVVTDTLLAAIAIQATTLSAGFFMEFKRQSATTVQKQGSANALLSYAGESTSAYPGAVTVQNLDTLAQYVSIGCVMGGTTDTPTLQDLTIELFSTDSA